MRIGCGILAVFNDCASGDEAAYEDWYLNEHLPERLAIPGFRWGRRYRRYDDGPDALPEYMTYYEVDAPEVLVSRPYLDRVNDPTPQTRKIMTSVFRNMNRTICARVDGAGAIRTPWTVAVVAEGGAALSLAELPARTSDMLWREAWQDRVPADHEMSREEQIRGGDARISECLVIDQPSEEAALLFCEAISGDGHKVAAFRLTGSLRAEDLE
ncbi:MAG: hypothetical protein AAF479_09865 [Pseudomonadota bacterium]